VARKISRLREQGRGGIDDTERLDQSWPPEEGEGTFWLVVVFASFSRSGFYNPSLNIPRSHMPINEEAPWSWRFRARHPFDLLPREHEARGAASV
jgi:hypothetical protein